MTPQELLEDTTQRWADDPDSDVVWTGAHEGRWGIRMSQQARDFTTVWFDVGDITIGFEAYLLPPPPDSGKAAVFEFCLKRNHRSWPAYIAADSRGELYIRGRIPVDYVTEDDIERAVGAVYEVVETSFRQLIELGYRR